MVQPWHPGPFEAGLFYARHPDESRGRILSITDKVFPVVVGDGRSTLADLVASHPRFRLQRETFFRRHASQLDMVLDAGRKLPLAEVGNHSQGTMFLDGARLWSPALEQRIDEIARAVPGFFIGRFDVRYTDVDRFRSGDDISVIELNGVTAEPTDIYDPGRTLMSAYAALFDQWRRVFRSAPPIFSGAARVRQRSGCCNWASRTSATVARFPSPVDGSRHPDEARVSRGAHLWRSPPNPSLHRTCYSGLRPAPQGG